MNSEENRKKLERQARSLILKKEISPSDRERINSLMRSQSVPFEERYTAIINILRKAPDRETAGLEDDEYETPAGEIKKSDAVKKAAASTAGKREPVMIQPGGRRYPDINGPTETRFFIDEIYYRYRRYNFFKKRYLARRDNRFGFGWSKRLIPAKKFLFAMNEVRAHQEELLTRLPQILERILKDENAESPLEFNYLRQLRRWMIISPLSTAAPNRIKWMEQWDFEREFKSYVIYFHSFMRLETETREQVISTVEKYLRLEPDLLKEDLLEADDRSVSIRKENDNFRKEKYIFEYMGIVRSFIAIHGEADSLLASTLKNKYGLMSLEDFLNMALEALVFQRPFSLSELREYFEIRTLNVSNVIWDLNNARLKMYGKDPESKRKRQAEKLKSELFWYDTLFQLVRIEENSRNILVQSVDDQWKYVDRINRDAEDSCKNNFIVFLEGIFHYFRNLIAPILNGTPLMFDRYGESVEGSLFTRDFFMDELREMDSLAVEIYNFRNLSPTLKVSSEEIKKIIARKISSMNHVEGIVFKSGSAFYAIASKLQEVYHNHVKASGSEGEKAERFNPLEPAERDSETLIPFSGCLFKGFEPNTHLQRKLSGKKVLSDNLKGGVLVFVLAYCYQAAFLCGYPQVTSDLNKRDIIKRQIKELQGEPDDTER